MIPPSRTSGWWLVQADTVPTSSVMQIIPLGDIIEHEQSRRCACDPVPERVLGEGNVTRTWMWKHRAYDQRE